MLVNFVRWKEKKQPLFCVYKNMEEVFFGDFLCWQHVGRNKHLWLCVYKTVSRGGCYYFWVLTNSNSIVSTSENVYILLKEVAVVIWQITLGILREGRITTELRTDRQQTLGLFHSGFFQWPWKIQILFKSFNMQKNVIIF